MYIRVAIMGVLGAILACGPASAQQPPAAAPAPAPAPAAAPNPLDTVPDAMPFSTPYGPPISAAKAQAAIQAAAAEATKRNWPLNIAVVDSGANLVAFLRMDGGQIGSIAISEHKARASVKFRRPTKAFEDAVQLRDAKYLITLDD